MHMVVRRYRLDEGNMDEAMHRVDTSMADRLSHEPGFIAYECAATSPVTIMSVTVFRDEAGCDRSSEIAGEFVRDELSDMKISKTDEESGAVAVSRAAREVLEPAHA
jgi:hypothetical protein